jgi:hypothetical protein
MNETNRMNKKRRERSAIVKLLNKFPSIGIINDLEMPDSGELGHRLYPITATDKEIIEARKELARLGL